MSTQLLERQDRTWHVPMAPGLAEFKIIHTILRKAGFGDVPMAPGMAGLRISPWLLEKQVSGCPDDSWNGRTCRVPSALGKAALGVSP